MPLVRNSGKWTSPAVRVGMSGISGPWAALITKEGDLAGAELRSCREHQDRRDAAGGVREVPHLFGVAGVHLLAAFWCGAGGVVEGEGQMAGCVLQDKGRAERSAVLEEFGVCLAVVWARGGYCLVVVRAIRRSCHASSVSRLRGSGRFSVAGYGQG